MLLDLAYLALQGVGDATLGEWRETGTAVHVRRRLKPSEMRYAGIREVVDVRGTDEFTRRIRNIRPYLPAPLLFLPDEALT